MPRVSVIVPIYNVEKYLRECLDSIINQTLKEIEIILVDDGSPDNSGAICDEYAQNDSRIKVIHKENGGLGNARNVAMTYATGEYVGFVDSDDFVDLDFFEKLYIKAISENADISCGDMKRYINNKDVPCSYETDINKFPKYYIEDRNYLLFTPAYCYGIWRKIYRRKFLEEYNLRFPEKFLYEDMPFMYKSCLATSMITVVSGVYYHYRINKKSIMNTANKKVFDIFEIMKMCKSEILKIEKNNIDKDIKAFLLFEILIYSSQLYHISKEYYSEFRQKVLEIMSENSLKNNSYMNNFMKIRFLLMKYCKKYTQYKICFSFLWFVYRNVLKNRLV